MSVNAYTTISYGIDLGRADECKFEGAFGDAIRSGDVIDDNNMYDFIFNEHILTDNEIIEYNMKSHEAIGVDLVRYSTEEPVGLILTVFGTARTLCAEDHVLALHCPEVGTIEAHRVERFMKWCDAHNVPTGDGPKWLLSVFWD